MLIKCNDVWNEKKPICFKLDSTLTISCDLSIVIFRRVSFALFYSVFLFSLFPVQITGHLECALLC